MQTGHQGAGTPPNIINSSHACRGRTAAPSRGCTSLVKRAVLIHSDTAHPSVHCPFGSVRNSVSLPFCRQDEQRIIDLTANLTPAANGVIFKKQKHRWALQITSCGWKKCYYCCLKRAMTFQSERLKLLSILITAT